MITAFAEKGVKVVQCERCGKVFPHTGRHACFQTGWTAKTTGSGLPKLKDVLISQEGRNVIKVSRQANIDEKKLAKDFERYKQYRIMKNAETSPTSLERSGAVEQLQDVPLTLPTVTPPPAIVVTPPPNTTQYPTLEEPMESTQVTTVQLDPNMLQEYMEFSRQRQHFLGQMHNVTCRT